MSWGKLIIYVDGPPGVISQLVQLIKNADTAPYLLPDQLGQLDICGARAWTDQTIPARITQYILYSSMWKIRGGGGELDQTYASVGE
jgi:hypothetical protein